MVDLPCASGFVTQLAEDLGVDQLHRALIKVKVEASLENYNKNAPTDSPASILSEGQKCTTTSITDFAGRFSKTFVGFVIACVIIVFVISISMFAVIIHLNNGWIFALIIAVVGLIALALAFYFAYLAVRDELTTTSKKLTDCRSKVTQDLQTFTDAEETAILNALCYYASLP